ncbi:protein SOSEKI 2 [Salvia miltiorrhiza]|uniref:protein SOSEKI 2 n=1 Tax=Salvia miltiorrhiza TaxID=226208 RepID=UPI0025AB9FB3|nr:protein SOSEKI 2 [Salvia miltiorrhiza]
MEVGRRIRREMSPERAKMCGPTRVIKPTFKKVQVVYYLSTNGHLHHPHYIEVSHLAHQHLRLKDVLDRLKVLRGKGMPSLYSWSCKRSFKNGYVWNDLGHNDVIYPSEGGEYVLKGSELLVDCTEKLQQLQFGNVQQFQHQESNLYPSKRGISAAASKQQMEEQEMMNVDEEEYEEKATCSRGVSTDEIEQDSKHKHKNSPHTELNMDTNSLSSPPSTTSSTPSDNPNNEGSKRFEDVGNEPMLSRNSMLFNLIACGGSASFRKAAAPPPPPPCTAGRKSCSLHKGVVCKAAKMATEEERLMISYMSENPRFGNSQAEDKEYFSGSIVDSITNDSAANQPVLNKSSSYNQDRCAKAGLGGEEAEEQVKKEKGLLRGKCIPRKKKSSSKHPKN